MSRNRPKSDSWQSLLQLIAAAWPPERWRHLGVVVGCSGGADSVALLRSLCELSCQPGGSGDADESRGFILAAHFNHRLRCRESEEDEIFVRDLAQQLGLRFATASTDVVSRDEASMRNERLRFLSQTASRCGARYVALAHSLNDNVETVLHHLFRGTGPSGLTGISSHRSLDQDLVLIRPMLVARRESIRHALRSIGGVWREDSSNQQTDYRRNWIRHELMPMIESQYPSASDAIGRAIAGQTQWRDAIDRQATGWLQRQRSAGSTVSVRCDADTDVAVVVAGLHLLWREQHWPRGGMSHHQWLQLARTLASSEPERYSLPGSIDVISDGRLVRLQRLDSNS